MGSRLSISLRERGNESMLGSTGNGPRPFPLGASPSLSTPLSVSCFGRKATPFNPLLRASTIPSTGASPSFLKLGRVEFLSEDSCFSEGCSLGLSPAFFFSRTLRELVNFWFSSNVACIRARATDIALSKPVLVVKGRDPLADPALSTLRANDVASPLARGGLASALLGVLELAGRGFAFVSEPNDNLIPVSLGVWGSALVAVGRGVTGLATIMGPSNGSCLVVIGWWAVVGRAQKLGERRNPVCCLRPLCDDVRCTEGVRMRTAGVSNIDAAFGLAEGDE
eukprot:3943871-Pyramimonas_sp.AAC.1